MKKYRACIKPSDFRSFLKKDCNRITGKIARSLALNSPWLDIIMDSVTVRVERGVFGWNYIKLELRWDLRIKPHKLMKKPIFNEETGLSKATVGYKKWYKRNHPVKIIKHKTSAKRRDNPVEMARALTKAMKYIHKKRPTIMNHDIQINFE